MLTIVLFLLAIVKLLTPTESLRNRMRHVLGGLAEAWISINNTILSLYQNPRWNIQIPEGLDHEGCYLVSSNHQSWVDVLVLQRAFNHHLPFFRFFIKSTLIWVPFLGDRLVGAGHAVHAPPFQGETGQTAGTEGAGPGKCTQGLREIQNHPGSDDQFP